MTARDFIENELLPWLWRYDKNIAKYLEDFRHKWDKPDTSASRYCAISNRKGATQ